jgi:hypothetical protein
MADDNPATVPAPAGAHKPIAPISELIERWWQDHFPGSAVASHAEAWNVAHAAKEALKRILDDWKAAAKEGSD